MLIRFIPLLLLTLTLSCFGLATGEQNPPSNETSSENVRAASASSSLVIIATVTPVPEQALTRVEALVSATGIATAMPTLTPQATGAPAQAFTDTPVPPAPTETPTFVSSTPTLTPSPTPVTPTIVPLPGMSSAETQIFVDHNEVRDAAGLSRLRTHDALMAIARERAANMASLQQMTHYNPNGSTVFDMMAAYGYPYVNGSENIHFNWGYSAQQSVQVAVESWIASPSHYASIVNPNLGRIGIGIATAANGTVYYSVVFSD